MSGALKSLSREFPQDGTNLAQEFRTLALRYSEIGAMEGIRVIPFLSPEMPLYLKASEEERRAATEFLAIIVSIHEETLAGGDTAIDTRSLIWRALGRYSLVPGGDIFDKMGKEDVILIYNDQHSAIFWNLQFFKYSSITIEQLFFDTWPNITWRESHIQQDLIEFVHGLTKISTTMIIDPKVPGHEVQELGTPENIRTWMEIPWVAVLTRDRQFAGYLAIQHMRIIEKS